MRLAAAIRAGLGRTPARDRGGAVPDQGAQWQAVLPVLAEAEGGAAGGDVAGGGAQRVLDLPNGWTVRREKVKGGYLLRFTGTDAAMEWLQPLFDAIERRFLPQAGRRAIGLGRAERGLVVGPAR